MAKKPTALARELRKTPIKKMFECEALADRETGRFKKWFKENYGYEHSKAREAELATALFSYCAKRKDRGRDTLRTRVKGDGFEITPLTTELKAKSTSFIDDSFTTMTLRDILKTREGQCVAFTSLYCMLAEELGMKNIKPFEVTHNPDGTPLAGGHVVAALMRRNMAPVLFDPANYKPNVKYKGRPQEKEYLLVAALSNKGVELKRHEEALLNYDIALKIKPDYVEALICKGHALSGLGLHKEAIRQYDKALKVMPKNPIKLGVVLGDKGLALSHLGRYEEAIRSYDKALAAIDKNHPALFANTLELKLRALALAGGLDAAKATKRGRPQA